MKFHLHLELPDSVHASMKRKSSVRGMTMTRYLRELIVRDNKSPLEVGFNVPGTAIVPDDKPLVSITPPPNFYTPSLVDDLLEKTSENDPHG